MGRDFWVRPSEGMIRSWCRTYSAGFDFETDYQPWVVQEFSGILCVDEVYQGQLALLLAVDPAAPDGDRLVGYQLVHGSVDASDVEQFLKHLKAVGIEPDEVVTDGSKLYPAVLAQVWPETAHQLCLFHETRHVTKAVMKVVNTIRKQLPALPPNSATMGGGPLRSQPPRSDPTHPATQRWYWRQVQRRQSIMQVHELARQGFSHRAITRQTGHHRQTVKQWLQQPIPALSEQIPAEFAETGSLPVAQPCQLKKQQLKQRVHTLAQEGLSYSAISRQVGIHRATVKQWLQQAPPSLEIIEVAVTSDPDEASLPPPAPWSSWDEVRQTREALHHHRFLLLRHPANLTPAQQQQVETLLVSPVGPELQVAHSFLSDWYRLWKDEAGQRRPLAEAQRRYEAWRTHSTYRAVPQLSRVQDQMTPAKFEQLSHFLHQPDWEATNNGAERAGRAFRHRQAPHFNLRKKEVIENSINVAACLGKKAALQPPSQPFHTCQRGRKKQQQMVGLPQGVY
jgi:transposase